MLKYLEPSVERGSFHTLPLQGASKRLPLGSLSQPHSSCCLQSSALLPPWSGLCQLQSHSFAGHGA